MQGTSSIKLKEAIRVDYWVNSLVESGYLEKGTSEAWAGIIKEKFRETEVKFNRKIKDNRLPIWK